MKILAQSSRWVVNKLIAKITWPEASLLLSYLSDKYDYYRERWELVRGKWEDDNMYFFCTSETIESDLWYSYHILKKNTTILVEKWLLKVDLFGVPATLHYSICEENILEVINPSFQKISKPVFKKSENQFSKNFNELRNNNKEINNNTNIVSKDTTKSEDFEAPTRKDIDILIKKLKDVCSEMWVAYDRTKERRFAKHILQWKDYWEFSEKIWQERTEFAVNILKASVKINFWKGVCSWPMKIYQNYWDVYNETKMVSKKKIDKSKVAFIPWIWLND